MTFDKYPHTELQDLNLDWILAQVKGFKADLGTLQTQFNTMSIDFASIQSQFANLSDQVNNLMQTMQDEIERYCDSVIPGKVDAAVAPYIVQLQDALAEVEALKNKDFLLAPPRKECLSVLMGNNTAQRSRFFQIQTHLRSYGSSPVSPALSLPAPGSFR